MRLFMDGEWYEPLAQGSLYEAEFEGLIMSQAQTLFPDFIVNRFDPFITTPLGGVKPDMVLVDREYRSWFIVEVELSTHSIMRHVRPQVEKIDIARVDGTHVEWLAARNPKLDPARLRRLMLDIPHTTTLLVNAPTPHWDEALQAMPSVQRAVVEVFRNRLNKTILRVNGVQPQTPGGLVSVLSRGTGYLSNAYRLEIASAFTGSTTTLDVYVRGILQRFRVKRLGKETYLFNNAGNMTTGRTVRLMIDQSDTYRIEE